MKTVIYDKLNGAATTLTVKDGVMEAINHDTDPRHVQKIMDVNHELGTMKQHSNDMRHIASIPTAKFVELQQEFNGLLQSQRRNKVRPCDVWPSFHKFLGFKILNNSEYSRFRTWQGKI